jgi:hypothetical protein
MIIANQIYENMFNSVAREFVGRVELLEGSTLVRTFEHDNELISFTIEKTGDNTKLFGYGISQKLTVKLRDKERQINVQNGQTMQVAYGISLDYLYTNPQYKITNIERDENTNDLTITAYDALYFANGYTYKDVILPKYSYTIEGLGYCLGAVLGYSVKYTNVDKNILSLRYSYEGMNALVYEGTETVRELLDDIAEMLGAIYFLNKDWELEFKSFDIAGAPVATIDKSKYFTLSLGTEQTLGNIVSIATELNDTIAITDDYDHVTQYFRDNDYLTVVQDPVDILRNIYAKVKGLAAYQCECKYRGDFRLELGDKINLITKDDQTITTYILADSITYNGGLVGTINWEYSKVENETEDKPASISDAIKQTYAKVDKANNRIELVAAESEKRYSEMIMTTDQISQRVASVESSVSMAMTPTQVQYMINSHVPNEVETTTGFTFNKYGLKITQSTSTTSTHIDSTGMIVVDDTTGSQLLVANHQGVVARDLEAATYLTIGNSRFENWEDTTAVYYIGASKGNYWNNDSWR